MKKALYNIIMNDNTVIEDNIITSRADKAAEMKKSGKYKCAQAVACAFADCIDADEETIKNMTQAFGVGMGTLEATCGALIGAGVVLGMANKDRVKTVQDVRAVMNSFIERNGTVTCKELKGVGTGKVVRECVDCVRDAAEFLEAALKNS